MELVEHSQFGPLLKKMIRDEDRISAGDALLERSVFMALQSLNLSMENLDFEGSKIHIPISIWN